ncbi:efflux RND transporter periplasmic adaptor subunit [Paenibacillus wenxiniae]|uniref:Efflux RND transporter periplasmic adaptor subunit n=1 Tax=Paenibacillus wenxiniae TaxID=1636843 RepID=A0ABW4RGR2_9BACL
MRIKKWEMTATALVLSTVLLAGCSNGNEAASTMNVTVKVASAQQGRIGQGEVYTGTVNPSETVNIVPKMMGKIAAVSVDVGTPVKPGQVLFKLEDDDLRNNLKIAQSNVDAAAAGVQTAQASRESGIVSANSGVVGSKSGVISAKSAITQAQNGINQAQSAVNQTNTALKQAQIGVSTANNVIKQTAEALKTAQSTLTRTQSLLSNGLATQAALEQAQAAVSSAQTAYNNAINAKANAEDQLQAAQNAVATANKGLATARESYSNATSGYANANDGYSNAQRQLAVSQSTAGIEASQQKLKQAQLNVDIARDQLDNAVVKSPSNGIVVTKNIEVGEMTPSGAASLVISDIDTVHIIIYVPAGEIDHVQKGDSVQINVSASNVLATGQVTRIDPQSTNGNGYPVEIAVSNKDGKLKPGMLANVSFISHEAREGLIIPTKAVVQDGKHAYVYIAVKGKAIRKQVTIGTTSGAQTLITGGLKAGDQVIENNQALLDSNTTITLSQNG